MSAAHGSPLRGLLSTSHSPMFEGRFGRMFQGLRTAKYGKNDADTTANLMKLGAAMEAVPDTPHDGADSEESGIPAMYTYFGQFIDHDLTFGPEGTFQKQRDPAALVDFRTPAFDLDCVYGRGPGDQPYMYDSSGTKFLLGAPLQGGTAAEFDLARNTDTPARALIGDPRNDENSIVSQLQGLFLRFHNRLVDDNPTMAFADVQRELQRHYQYVILNDFLPRIIAPVVLNGLKTDNQFDEHRLRFYHPKHSPFMPVEFATAAYRFGHSMIRPGYRLNDNDATLLAIFAATPDKDLRGKYAMPAIRGMDWARFIDLESRPYDGPAGSADQKRRLQFAYRIDTSLVNPLANLPPNVAGNPPASLAQRNLLRSFDLGLPSGQAIAHAMHQTPLSDQDIVVGKAVDAQDPGERLIPIAEIDPVFAGNCPLWTYILAEAIANKAAVPVAGAPGNGKIITPQLGPVGGRIVAETFLGLMFGDSTSLLRTQPNWTPKQGSDYKLKDFVAYALGMPFKAAAGK